MFRADLRLERRDSRQRSRKTLVKPSHNARRALRIASDRKA